jgi:hypothetical protein
VRGIEWGKNNDGIRAGFFLYNTSVTPSLPQRGRHPKGRTPLTPDKNFYFMKDFALTF